MRYGGEAEGHGGAAVAVDPGADARGGGEERADGAGDDAGESVHVVQDGVGVPEDEAEEGEEDGGAGQARAAQHVVAPAVAAPHHGGGDGVGDVVEDGGRQGLGEGAQAQHFAVQDLLGREGAGAVEDGARAQDQVEAGGCADGLGLAGEAQQLGVDVGDGDALGEGDVHAAVGSHDGDPAEARRLGGVHLVPPVGVCGGWCARWVGALVFVGAPAAVVGPPVRGRFADANAARNLTGSADARRQVASPFCGEEPLRTRDLRVLSANASLFSRD